MLVQRKDCFLLRSEPCLANELNIVLAIFSTSYKAIRKLYNKSLRNLCVLTISNIKN